MLIWSSLPADFIMRVRHSCIALMINSVKTKCRAPLTMTIIEVCFTVSRLNASVAVHSLAIPWIWAMDRRAELAMTVGLKFWNGLPRWARNETNHLFSITARRLNANVAVHFLEAWSIKSECRIATLCSRWRGRKISAKWLFAWNFWMKIIGVRNSRLSLSN